ncbi:sodium-dependent transporter [Pseudobutyrivibrio xylanivorans]|uniref:Transporter n=1 Tax=Pseudobutyrivibrio xylanivorans DSM 14809 TaxID=1123012 RepID=A0A1M6ABW9_PSEXY|nr:sodium-dependent transporter [Pseudobutyrivibrio xylanivorans]SHI34000.1 neurotransmitter:Na+ symporter, NSS family [Pseudobutyrivibrio xylanivorans DSM 14809]
MEQEKRGSFSGKIGFVLSTAGASVGLGNIWRFPYLCAKYGGGIFLIVYVLLALTFGYTMIVAETAIGRATNKSPVGAFRGLSHNNKLMKLGGWINAIIPILIVPYYSVIGGWVCKYLFEYIRGDVNAIAGENFFTSFITDGAETELWFIVFAILVLVVIYLGVENGIERVSKIVMPILVLLALVICVYSVTRPGAISGVKYLFIPNFKHFSIMTVVTAMGQMFYSLSIAMGILITFGSYVKKEVSIEESTKQVEIFDTAIAVIASLMIIPAVFAFSGGDESMLKAGPSLMFITMPKIFASMGFGRVIGIAFFALVLFAAVTSAIALTESAVSTFSDEFKWDRHRGVNIMAVIMLVLGSLSSLGYGPLANVKIIGMQFLDFFDFLTNSIMMPIAALAICVLITKFMTVEKLEAEVEQENHPFKRKGVFRFMIKFLCPLFVVIILVSAVLNVFGIISM